MKDKLTKLIEKYEADNLGVNALSTDEFELSESISKLYAELSLNDALKKIRKYRKKVTEETFWPDEKEHRLDSIDQCIELIKAQAAIYH